MKTFKTILRNTAFIALLFSFNLLNAQMADSKGLVFAEIDSTCKVTCTLVSFTAKQVEGKVYLNWVVNGLKEDCIYFIQRSRNDLDFETIGTKNGVGIEPDIDILTCYTDAKPLSGKTYYRIATIDNLGKLKNSPSQIVNVEESFGVNNQMFVENN